MTSVNTLLTFLFLFIGWKSTSCQEMQNMNDLTEVPEKENFNIKDSRVGHNIPDMRLVLNQLLRYENSLRQPSETDNILTLTSRSKGAAISGDDPLAMLATGFHGSRGKRPSYDKIPVFAKGFPANRGKK